ncbi:MAG: hypothetical protein HZC29_07310, partial [Thaumarchaeota archaeon]|nr:hypothetical protein [Nitrososphaerota archaeon]
MQKLALLFLLAITASMMFSLNVISAQESTETPDDTMTDEEIVDETTGEEVTDEEAMADEEMTDEAMDEEMADDTMVEETTDETMEDTMEEETYAATPLQQLMGGTDPHEIECGEGLQLVFKATNFRPACVKESSYQILLQRGWASSHDPTHEELTAMVDSLPVQETEDTTDETTDESMDETTNEEVNIEEDVTVEEESSTGNGTEPTPQSYSIELAESMDMGA